MASALLKMSLLIYQSSISKVNSHVRQIPLYFSHFNAVFVFSLLRGVGAMEIVAMDMKLRGMYIARQLSFQGVGFRIDEVELEKDMRDIYNKSVELWVELLHKFVEAAALIDADKKMKKTMWGQFWSSHQR